MSIDVVYTNGVIAAREKHLLKDKIIKLCSSTPEEAIRILIESGYGGGAESGVGYEGLIEAEERSLDAFIREYAPSESEKAYLLSGRDFHNAKALLKAAYLGTDAEKLLAPEGTVAVETLKSCAEKGDFSPLYKELKAACEEAYALLKTDEEDGTPSEVSGAEIGGIFEKALYRRLVACAKNATLKALVRAKADMTNVLTALRSVDRAFAEKYYADGGKISPEKLSAIFTSDEEKQTRALDGTPYAAFYKKCLAEKRAGKPFTAGEKERDSYDTAFLAKKKYELKKSQPFLYYVFRRRAENADVRIVFVCLSAGMKEEEIRKRLRSV